MYAVLSDSQSRQFGWPLKCRKFNLRPGTLVENRVNNKACGTCDKKVN